MSYFKEIIRQEVLIIPMNIMPRDIIDLLKDQPSFANGVFLEHLSEFSPTQSENDWDWSETLSDAEIAAYHRDQVATNNYKSDLATFITEYGLQIDKWLIGLNLDLKGIKLILFHIVW